jgi:hydrogenase 3 maturation protease
VPVENLILAVGNSMMGDDGAGPLLAEMLQAKPVDGWLAIDGGSSPENVAHQVFALQPQRVFVVDAAEMGLAPGEVRFVDDACIAELFIMTTHSLPLTFLIERLREQVAEVFFLGIQPDVVAFYCPMTMAVKNAVEQLYTELKEHPELERYRWLVAAENHP